MNTSQVLFIIFCASFSVVFSQKVTPSFGDMTKGGMKDKESGSQDWGNGGNCMGGDWSNKGSYWYQGPCNGGASWFVADALMGSNKDYDFTVRILNEDNDDSGVILRYTDKNNYIRFHHTLDNAYNSDGRVSGCQGKGSFLVLRKGGKETCLATSTWKYSQGKWHTFRVISKTTTGQIKVYVDGQLLVDHSSATVKGLTGSCGIWVAHSQMKMDSFSFMLIKAPVVKPPKPVNITGATGIKLETPQSIVMFGGNGSAAFFHSDSSPGDLHFVGSRLFIAPGLDLIKTEVDEHLVVAIMVTRAGTKF